MNIIQLLLFTILLILPFGQILRASFFDGLIHILFLDVIIALVVIVDILKKNKTFLSKKAFLFGPILSFIAVAIISLFVNIKNFPLEQIGISSLYLIRFMLYTGVYFVLQSQPRLFKTKFTYGLLLSGFAFTLIGIFQYFFYPDLRNLYYAGWDEHLYRLFSSLLDPNFAGGLLTLEFILICSIMLKGNIKKTWQKLGIFFMAFLTFVALLLTYSRSTYIMAVVSAIIFLLLSGRKKMLVGFLILFTLGILILPKDLRSEGVNLFRTASIEARAEEAKHAITIIKNNWLVGVGFNTYRFAKRDYGFLDENSWREVHSGAGTENSLLFVFVTTGIVGLVTYMFLFYKICILGKRSAILLVSIIGLFVHSLFVNSLFYPHTLIWIWILAGLTEKS